MHNSTTLEPTHEEMFAFFRETHNPTPMDPSNYDNFALSDHLGELVLSPTSYTSKFCSIHPNEAWVKGFFFIVLHDEYGLHISPFDDEMTIVTSYLHFQKHPLLHYDDTHLLGCIYHLSHLETHDFPCSFPSPFDVGGTSSHTWVKRYMIEEPYCWQKNPFIISCLYTYSWVY